MPAEEKLLEILLNQNHMYLILGIFAFMYFLRAIKPIKTYLFDDDPKRSKKWYKGGKWLLPIINLALSSIGVFLLGMTNATTMGMKCIIVLIITSVTTYGYQLTKPLFKKVLGKLFGAEPEID